MKIRELRKNCDKCEHCQIIQTGINYTMLGCFHEPYKGRWVAEITKCPKEVTVIRSEMQVTVMTRERAEEVIEMHEQCKIRKESCRWFCEICEFGQYMRTEYLEAIKMKEEENG